MEETAAVDLARPAPPPQGRRAADCLPQGGSPPPARLFYLCDLRLGHVLEASWGVLGASETRLGPKNRPKIGPGASKNATEDKADFKNENRAKKWAHKVCTKFYFGGQNRPKRPLKLSF